MYGSRHKDAGFTLVEVTAVLVIIGVLLLIAIATYAASTARAGAVACENNRRLLERTAASEYRAEHGTDPADIDALAPYVFNWDTVRACPTDVGQLLYFDTDGTRVVCPIHGK